MRGDREAGLVASYTKGGKAAQGVRSAVFCCRMRALFFLLIGLVTADSAIAQACPHARVALVLSGGGAKGLAHIGVLQVLDSLGIRPDLVVGSSMGAIIGGMYASGYSGREIDSLARSLPIAGLFRTYQPQAPRSLGSLQPLVVWEQGEHRFKLQSAAVSEAEVNALVNAAMCVGPASPAVVERPVCNRYRVSGLVFMSSTRSVCPFTFG